MMSEMFVAGVGEDNEKLLVPCTAFPRRWEGEKGGGHKRCGLQ